jgi:NAD(P) transhydrogenase subunit beta
MLNLALGWRVASDRLLAWPKPTIDFALMLPAGLHHRRHADHPDRRRRHAGGGVDAQQLLRLGGGGHRLLAEQQHADHRRLAGGLSGAILSYIMCKAMNRSFFNVILGGFGGEAGAAAGRRAGAAPGQERQRRRRRLHAQQRRQRDHRARLRPGGGARAARGQGAGAKLTDKGIDVKYAIHPVAGRMPGHMNVLLAEAEVPYDQVFEMEDINGEFGQADVAIILGANDVVNPAAHVKGSPIYGMPILEAYKAKTVIVNKRSMAAGYAGLDNELFYMDKTMMVFGDAKKVVEDIGKAIE